MKHPGRFSLQVILALALIAAAAAAPAGDAMTDFERANLLYERGDYDAAIEAYRNLLAADNISAAVYFNLGNAHARAGETGYAIAAYRNALKLAPRDPDARANLQFVRRKVANGEPERQFLTWMERLSLNEWTALAGASLLICFALLTLRQFNANLRTSLRGPTAVAAILTVILLICLALVIRNEYFIEEAVIIAPEATARLGPFEESRTAFTARDGTELRVLDHRDGWVRVINRDHQTGWIQTGVLKSERNPKAEIRTSDSPPG